MRTGYVKNEMSSMNLNPNKTVLIPLAILTILFLHTLAVLSANPSRVLEVRLSLDKEVYPPGDSFTFSISVSNSGDEWIDIYYYKLNIKHSSLPWFGGDFTTEETDIDFYLEPGETKEYSTTRRIPRIPTWLNTFGDWQFTLILIDDEGNEFTSNTLTVKLS